MEAVNKVEVCPKCGLPMPACVCGEIAKTQQRISVSVEKRRFGKVNTIISGFDDGVDIKSIAKVLKMKRACGGTTKNNVIELQGNHKGFIKPILVMEGFSEDQIDE
jgi:translation initiation factor 1